MKKEHRFTEGEKVYWNAGWNNHLTWPTQQDYYDHPEDGKPFGWMLRGPYDFGYYSQTEGKVILYEEGCKNMQDSFCVFEDYVITEKEYRYVRGIEKWEDVK